MPPERVLRILLTQIPPFRGSLVGPETSPRDRRVCRDVRFTRRRCGVGSRSAMGTSCRSGGARSGQTGGAPRPSDAGSPLTVLNARGTTYGAPAPVLGERASRSLKLRTETQCRTRGEATTTPSRQRERLIRETQRADQDEQGWSCSTPVLSLLERLGGSQRKRPGYVLRLRVLVDARGLLYQSNPSIEARHVNTLSGRCKSNPLPPGQVRTAS